MTTTATAKNLAATLTSNQLAPAATNTLQPSATPPATGLSSLHLPPPKQPLSMNNALAQNSPPNSSSTGRSIFDALNDGLNAADKALKGDQAGAIQDAKRATQNAAAGAKGVLNETEKATQGTPLEQIGRDLKKIGTAATDVAKTTAELAIGLADIVWSNNPTQNLQNITKIVNLLSSASTSTIVDLDKQMRDISSSNPQLPDTMKKLSQAIGQVVSLYDDTKKTLGFNPASIDPNIDKFMNRLKEASKDLGSFINNYGDYHQKAKGLPQMGTFADQWDYAKSRLSFDHNHAMKRIDRNQAADSALNDWSKFKKNLDSLIRLDDFK